MRFYFSMKEVIESNGSLNERYLLHQMLPESTKKMEKSGEFFGQQKKNNYSTIFFDRKSQRAI